MSRIVEELERQDIVPTYENIAIYAVFVAEEGLIDRLNLNNLVICSEVSIDIDKLD